MKFSIIVPVFNVACYLPECLHSIDAQTYRDYEVILIDDGSTDGSSVICDIWAEDKDNVAVVHQENKGLLLARREGYLKSCGEYIVSLDSDDMLKDTMLEECAKVIENYSPDIVAFTYTKNRDFSCPISSSALLPGFYIGTSFNKIKARLCDGYNPNIWSKVFKTDVFDPGFPFNDYAGLMHGEDLLQVFPAFDVAKSLYFINHPLYFYRIHERSSTSEYSANKIEDLARVCRVTITIAKKWGPEFYGRACIGMEKHFCGVAMLLFGDSSVSNKREEFSRLAKTFQDCLGSMVKLSSLHIHQKIIVNAMSSNNYTEAAIVSSLYRLVKKSEKKLVK